MLSIRIDRAAGTAAVLTDEETKIAYQSRDGMKGIENRNDWKSFEAAQEVAALLGPLYVATDAGPYVSPRYDVIDLPQVGADVSYGFNGDAYPCGKIKSISKGPGYRRIVAGPDFSGKDRTFWRRCRDGQPTGGGWINEGTWSLIPGTVDKHNPEF